MDKNQVKDWLEEQKKHFVDYLDDMRKHKVRALNPFNQGKIMASAGVIAFIDEEIKFIESLNCDYSHDLGKEISQ